MPEEHTHAKLPDAVSYMPRIIAALRDMDGIAKAAAVKDWIVSTMSDNGEAINDMVLDSGVPKFQNDIQWARMYLVNGKLLEPMAIAGRGVWMLTPAGLNAPIDSESMSTVYFLTSKKGRKAASESEVAPNDDDQQQSLPGTESWEYQLKKLLIIMPDKGFERLCAAIMTKNGLHATKVTGQSDDKGIDGEGFLGFDPLGLVSIRVAWQCKRYKDGTVGSEIVRNFRGSLDQSTNHGVIFTTSTYTASAMQEANQPGKKPIRLVDLSDLISQIFQLKLGISAEPPHTVDGEYFAKFLVPMTDQKSGTLAFTSIPLSAA